MDRGGSTGARWHIAASVVEAQLARPWLPCVVEGSDLVLASVDGSWFAVEDSCTHAGCPFSAEASLEGSTIVCNCHGSEFDIVTGAVLRGPAETPVRTVPTRVVGDRVEVEL